MTGPIPRSWTGPPVEWAPPTVFGRRRWAVPTLRGPLRRSLGVAIATISALASSAAPPTSLAQAPPPPPRVVGYLADWTVADSNRYRVADVPADRMTHLNLAFAQITGAGGIAHPSGRRGDLFAQLRRLKAAHPHLKLLISVGGWGGSKRFSDVALTDASRSKFAASCVEF